MTMPTFDFKFLIAWGLSCALCADSLSACWRQDNPFGSAPSTSSSQSPARDSNLPFVRPEISLTLPESNRLIIRAVYDANPQTPGELAKAVKTMMDIEAFDHAKFLLGKLQGIPPSDQDLYEMQATVGPDFFLALHGSSEMQPEGREFAASVFAAAKRTAYDPKRVESLVNAISNDNVSARSEAFRMLRRLGAPGAAALLNVFTVPERSKEFPFIRGALKSFGDQAIGPLVGGARANNLQMQVESVRALGYYPSSESVDAMLRVYLSPRFPESVRRSALDSMTTQFGGRGDLEAAENQLYRHAEDYLLGHRKFPNTGDGLATIWRWNSTTRQLEARTLPKITAERISAAERAADLFEINPNSGRNRNIYLLTQLEAAKRETGPSREIDVNQALSLFGSLSPDEVQAILTRALELDLIPAAIGACEILAEIGTGELLTNLDHRNSPLINALLYGNRHLQFAAMKAIAAIDPQQAFAGSSYVTSLAAYLAKSEGFTAGLVGHNRIALAQSYAAMIQQTGLYGRSSESSREFFRQATQNPDLGVLLVTDSLSKPDYVELAQQLRSDWRTKRIPIGLLVRDERYDRRVNRIIKDDPFLLVLPASFERSTIGSHVQRLLQLSEPWPVSNGERRLHAMTALKWLAKVASDREKYKFWDLAAHQEELAGLMYSPGLAKEASQILAVIGTPLAQRALVDFASQSGRSLEDRQAAVEAFEQSVRRAGTLLTTSEISLQYSRYNASENEPKASQQIFSRILDAIESRRDQVSSTE